MATPFAEGAAPDRDFVFGMLVLNNYTDGGLSHRFKSRLLLDPVWAEGGDAHRFVCRTGLPLIGSAGHARFNGSRMTDDRRACGTSRVRLPICLCLRTVDLQHSWTGATYYILQASWVPYISGGVGKNGVASRS